MDIFFKFTKMDWLLFLLGMLPIIVMLRLTIFGEWYWVLHWISMKVLSLSFCPALITFLLNGISFGLLIYVLPAYLFCDARDFFLHTQLTSFLRLIVWLCAFGIMAWIIYTHTSEMTLQFFQKLSLVLIAGNVLAYCVTMFVLMISVLIRVDEKQTN